MLRKVLLDGFGVPTGCWGWVGGRMMAAWNRDINEVAVEQLGAGPVERVLEIGYGPGTALALLGERMPDALLIGVDPSAEMGRQARLRNRALIRRGRVRLTLGHSARLPFVGERFDRVFTVNTIYFWPAPQADLAELRRVLKPGGRAVVTFRGTRTPDGTLSVRSIFEAEYTVDEVAAMLTAVGFREVRTEVRELRFVTAVCLVAQG
jgi:SAM-dependent methyltransferase